MSDVNSEVISARSTIREDHINIPYIDGEKAFYIKKIMTSPLWRHGVTWGDRQHDQSIAHGHFPTIYSETIIIFVTRKPSWRKGYARQRRHSKMAVRRHLGYYRTGNSAMRSTDPKNPCLEPDMEWIRCTVSEIQAYDFKLYCDLETGVRPLRGHWRSSNEAPLDRPTQKTRP